MKEIRKDPFFAEIDWQKLEKKEIEPPQILSKDNLPKDEEEIKMKSEKNREELVFH